MLIYFFFEKPLLYFFVIVKGKSVTQYLSLLYLAISAKLNVCAGLVQ